MHFTNFRVLLWDKGPTLAGLWVLSLFAKLAIGTVVPFFSDETYYWAWSLEPQLSYYDHPGAVAWMFWLGRKAFDFAQGERWPFVLATHLAVLPWLSLLKTELKSNQVRFWLLLVLIAPMPGLSALLSTPDVPLLFFWGLGTWFFHRALSSGKLWDHIGFGASVGLGFCSKYHIVLLPLCAAVYLAIRRAAAGSPVPASVRWSGIWVAAASFFVFSAPVWIWNAQNNFDSFTFQLKHGLGETHFKPQNPIIYLLGQVALIFPTFIPFFIKEVRTHWRHWLSLWALVPMTFFFATSFKGRVEPNWALPAYTAVYALIAKSTINPRHLRAVLLVWALTAVTVFAAILMPQHFHWTQKTRLRELSQYDVLLPAMQTYQPFFASSYQMASALSYATQQRVCKLHGMGRRDHYDYLPECIPGKKFYVIFRRWDQLPDWADPQYVRGRHPLSPEFDVVEYVRP